MYTNGPVLKMHMYTLLSIVCVIRIAECYSSGEVTQSCTDMTPRHTGASAQTTTSPHSVVSDRSSYSAGDEITVTLQAGSTAFIGFMLQARDVEGSGPIGSFTVTDVQAQLLSCNEMLNSTITHKSNTSKTNIQGLWRAPESGNVKDIEFRATFVQNFVTYWLQVKSPRVIYSAQPDHNISSDFNTTTIKPPNSMVISRDGCGSTKVCLSRPSGCDPSLEASCYFMATLTSPTDSAFQFEMSGPSQGYIAIGFSNDQLMGNDDIYICGLNRNGALQVQHAYSTGRRAPEILTLGNISDIRTSFLDGVISCSFTSRNPITTQRSAAMSSIYYLMFAYGPTDNGIIEFHTSTLISETEVDLSRPQTVNTNRHTFVKAHGALMLIAWMATGSLGMLIARYLKATTKGTAYCGKDLWFLLHVFLMMLSVAATIIAFILIFAHLKRFTGGVHSILGCLVMIMAFLQPLAAVFRCGPDHSWRYIFNWAHTLNAVAIKGLAVAAIFTGLSAIDRTEERWIQKVMGGFVGWEVLLYALQDFYFRQSQKDAEEGRPQLIKVDVILLSLFLLGNITFLVAILAGIGMS